MEAILASDDHVIAFFHAIFDGDDKSPDVVPIATAQVTASLAVRRRSTARTFGTGRETCDHVAELGFQYVLVCVVCQR
jgi:hypothetical protein